MRLPTVCHLGCVFIKRQRGFLQNKPLFQPNEIITPSAPGIRVMGLIVVTWLSSCLIDFFHLFHVFFIISSLLPMICPWTATSHANLRYCPTDLFRFWNQHGILSLFNFNFSNNICNNLLVSECKHLNRLLINSAFEYPPLFINPKCIQSKQDLTFNSLKIRNWFTYLAQMHRKFAGR